MKSTKILAPILTIVLMATTLCTSAQGRLTEQADSAYMHDNFTEALNLYQQTASAEGTSSDLYYNIGNCYYRLGQPGMAIVYYERALRLNPLNSNARANLQFVNSKITDEPGDRGMFISKTTKAIATRLPANTWAWLAIISFMLCLGGVALYIFPTSVAIRKTGFFGAIGMIALCVIANIGASISTRYATSSDEAVVIVPSTMLSTSPRTPKDRNEEAMLLHEGTKVEIIDSVTTRVDSVSTKWLDIKVDNEHRAWVRGADVERI